MTQDAPSKSSPEYISLFETVPAPCPYLPAREEKKIFTLLSRGENGHLASLLTQNGFRRNQGMFYRQQCGTCAACRAVRLLVHDFMPDRQMRRVQKRSARLLATVQPACATQELYALFKNYLASRHGQGGMADMSYEEFRQMVEDFPNDTRLLVLRDESNILMGTMLFDEMEDGTSAVYSFFSTQDDRLSLGTLLILKLAEYTAQTKRPHLYLGFWIRQSRKMSYKAKFQPLEVFVDKKWTPFDALGDAPLT